MKCQLNTTSTMVRSRWRGWAAAALAAALWTGTLLVGAPAQAVPAVPSNIFDPESVDWRSYRDQSSAGFAATFQQNVDDGYLIIDLEIDVIGNDYRVGSVWQENIDGRGWQELRDLSGSEFHNAWLAAIRRGMRLTEQETYYVDGRRRFAGVWVENVEGLGWASHRGLTSAEAVTAFDQQRRAGRMLIDIDQYLVDSSMRYSMVWVDNAEGLDWQLHSNLSYEEFHDKLSQLYGNFRLLAFESVKVGSTQWYTGIWIENQGGHHDVQVSTDVSDNYYDDVWEGAVVLGYRLVSYDKYVTPDGVLYATIWRANG